MYPRVDFPFPLLTLVGLVHPLHLLAVALLHLVVTRDPLQTALLRAVLLCHQDLVECTPTDCV